MNNLPNISILTPTFNRRKFLPLYLHNLTSQLYPHDKLEVCIDDDGTEPFIKKNELEQIKRHIYPIKLNYVKKYPQIKYYVLWTTTIYIIIIIYNIHIIC